MNGFALSAIYGFIVYIYLKPTKYIVYMPAACVTYRVFRIYRLFKLIDCHVRVSVHVGVV